MTPKASPTKAISKEDRVKTDCILGKDRFLRHYDNSKDSKKIIKAFEDDGLLYLITSDHKEGIQERGSTV